MAEQVNNTQEGADKPTTETTVKPKEGSATQPEAEKSIEDVINPQTKEEPKVVGLDKFLDIKKENKELKKQLADIEKRISEGEDKKEIANDIDSLAEEHNIDKGFLNKLVKSIESKAEKSLEDRINAKLEPLTAKEKENKINEVFTKAYAEVLERNPEFKNIANAEVIKTLATNPANGKKTLTQILEETYGNAIAGKRTIERTIPGGGKEPTEVDYKRAQTDSAYFKEVMANPKLKEKYNKEAVKDISRYL